MELPEVFRRLDELLSKERIGGSQHLEPETKQWAIEAMEGLMTLGMLHIITSNCRHDAKTPCEKVEPDVKSPGHFVTALVARLEERSNGSYRAYSEEGHYCQGQPVALLRRLLDWMR